MPGIHDLVALRSDDGELVLDLQHHFGFGMPGEAPALANATRLYPGRATEPRLPHTAAIVVPGGRTGPGDELVDPRDGGESQEVETPVRYSNNLCCVYSPATAVRTAVMLYMVEGVWVCWQLVYRSRWRSFFFSTGAAF